jgi:ribulose-5-phosphate 4-epimerase/fuculose-1-phosphate aldolase
MRPAAADPDGDALFLAHSLSRFHGPERDPAERDALARDLGQMNYLILRNHGLSTVGPTVAEALTAMYGLERSCQAQVVAMACNTELNHMPSNIVQKSIDMDDPTVIRRYGLLEWPGLLRKLDRLDPSYRD